MTEEEVWTKIEGMIGVETPRHTSDAITILDEAMTGVLETRSDVYNFQTDIKGDECEFSMRLRSEKTYKQDEHEELAKTIFEKIIAHNCNFEEFNFRSWREVVEHEEDDD